MNRVVEGVGGGEGSLGTTKEEHWLHRKKGQLAAAAQSAE